MRRVDLLDTTNKRLSKKVSDNLFFKITLERNKAEVKVSKDKATSNFHGRSTRRALIQQFNVRRVNNKSDGLGS